MSRAVAVTCVLGLVSAIAFAFWPGRDCQFIFDDIALIAKNDAVTSGDLFRALLGRGQVMANRPVTNFALALQHVVCGGSVFGHRCVSVLLHAVNVLLAFGVVRAALCSPALAGRFSQARAGGLAAAAATLWGLHPLLADTVAYTIQQSMLWMSMSALAAVLCLHRVHAEPGRTRWRWALVGCVAIGMAAKEEMAPAPLVLLLWQRAFLLADWHSLRPWRSLHLQLAATWLVLGYCIAAGPPNTTVGYHTEPRATAFEWLLTQARVVTHYFTSVFWPADLRGYYDSTIVRELGLAALPALVVLALLLTTVVLWRQRPVFGMTGTWAFLWLAPTSSVLPIVVEVVAERRMYLASLPLVAAAVCTAAALLRRLRVRVLPWLLVLAVAGAAAVTTRTRVAVYCDPVTFWRDATDRNELTNGSYQASLVLGSYAVALQQRGEPEQALPWFARAAVGAEAAPMDRLRYGIALAEHNDLAAAEPLLRRAVAELPDEPQAFGVLAGLLVEQHRSAGATADAGSDARLREALPLAQRAVALAPDRAMFVDTFALLLFRHGRHGEAEAQYRRALQLDPLRVSTWASLSDVLVAQGRLADAQGMWRNLLTANPGNAQLRVAIGRELLARGDRHNATVMLREACALAPADPAAKAALDEALRSIGR